jgi:hypothetical protein
MVEIGNIPPELGKLAGMIVFNQKVQNGLEIVTGGETIETFDSYGSLIPNFPDGKRNCLNDAYIVLQLANQYFKVGKKCCVKTFKHGTLHKRIGM